MASCDVPSTTSRPSAAATSTALPPTATPTLPVLRADTEWTKALDLGYVSDGVVTSGGAFEATNVYRIRIACEGPGNVVVEYEPQGTATFTCTPPLQPFLNVIGSSDHPPARQTISVNVTADSGVVWRAVIEVMR